MGAQRKLRGVEKDAIAPPPKTGAAERRLAARVAELETALEYLSQGVCHFDADWRLVTANARYAEIYRLPGGALMPGMTLKQIVEMRADLGASPTDVASYLDRCKAVLDGAAPAVWTAPLRDGRVIRMRTRPLPGGGWVSTHEEIDEGDFGRRIANAPVTLQTLIDGVPDYLWVKDRDFRFVVANKAIAADHGFRGAEDMVGRDDFDLHAPERARAFRAVEAEVLASGRAQEGVEETIVTAAGLVKTMQSMKTPLRDGAGAIVGIVGVARDVTMRRRADELRRGQGEILELIAQSAPLERALDAIVRLIESQLPGVFGAFLMVDPSGERLNFGAGPSLPPDYRRFVDDMPIADGQGGAAAAVLRRAPVMTDDVLEDPLWLRFRDAAVRHGLRAAWSTPIFEATGAVLAVFSLYSRAPRGPTEAELALIGVATRMASIAIERKKAEDSIRFMANHDPLTGLPNRALLNERLTQALRLAKREGARVWVAFLDIDNFKLVNDGLGHGAGDELLRRVAARIGAAIGEADTLVRLGGDEFVLLLAQRGGGAESVAARLRALLAAIGEPMVLAGRTLRVTGSLGVAAYPDDGTDAETLLANADAAMYRAKALGRDNFQVFTPAIRGEAQAKLSLREELRLAIGRGEFTLHYRPQVDLRSGAVFAVEALIRWNRPGKGLAQPADFIPFAEESGLIGPIGDWVLHEACRQNRRWQDAGLRPVTVCVNVSARQFEQPDFVARVADALAASGLGAERLELELTEGAVMRDPEKALDAMARLQALGVRLSIDDFGAGYAGLAALTSHSVVRLKIDRAFIRDIPGGAQERAAAAAVIALGRKLNLRVIAEGVETDAQVAFLRAQGCDEIQGRHFSMPVAAEEVAALLGADVDAISDRVS